MTYFCNHSAPFASYSKLKVLFHTPPEEAGALFDMHLQTIKAMEGCQLYSLRPSENPQFHLIFFGVWDKRACSLEYYQSPELQAFIRTLMKSGASAMEFEEIVVL